MMPRPLLGELSKVVLHKILASGSVGYAWPIGPEARTLVAVVALPNASRDIVRAIRNVVDVALTRFGDLGHMRG
jgi:hypothetical protein